MEPPLTAYQRNLAEHRIMFDHPLASDLEEALRRTSLACAENGKKETGLIEFFCGLYLHCRKGVSDHFNGDFDAVLTRTFPKHRYGVEGLVPDAILEKAAGDDESGGFPIRLNIAMKFFVFCGWQWHWRTQLGKGPR